MSVFSPRVTHDSQPDYSDVRRFAGFSGWRQLPAAERAVAIWRYLTDIDTGLYPVQGIYEDPDPGPEYAFYDERDLNKVLNVHGHGYCGLLSPALAGICAHAGFEGTRITNLRENHHCVTEVWYDGEWHYFDVDLRGLLRRPDGSVATLDEACGRPELWTEPAVPIEPFYPLDDRAALHESFAGCQLTRMYGWYKSGHTMDYVLRPGEYLTRFWYPQDGRWFHPWPNPGGFNLAFLRRRFAAPPRGLKCKHAGWTRWTHGNGLLTYAPRLDARHGDFAAGVHDCDGVEPGVCGLEARGESHATWRCRTPYIIVGQVVEMGPPALVQGAATVTFQTLGAARLSVSTDAGHSWTAVYATSSAAAATVDLSAHVTGRYEFLVRFAFAAGSGLAALRLSTWVQVAPPSLPRLQAGTNPLQYACGDRYGYDTSVHEIRLNLRDPAALERYLVRLEGEFRPLDDTCRLSGRAVLGVAAPPGRRLQWLTAGGYFHSRLGPAAAHNGNAIEWSVSGPDGPWQPLCRSRVPAWVEHWHYGMEEDLVLDQPAVRVYLRYSGDPGVNQIWVYAHVLDGRPVQPLGIEHGYELDGQPHRAAVRLEEPGSYTIDCPAEPENRYITFAADSIGPG